MVELSLHTHSPYRLIPIQTLDLLLHTHTPYLHGDVIPTTNVCAAGWVPLPWSQIHDEPTTIAGAAGIKVTTSHPRHNAKHYHQEELLGNGHTPPSAHVAHNDDQSPATERRRRVTSLPATRSNNNNRRVSSAPLQVLPGSAPKCRRHRQRSRSLSVRESLPSFTSVSKVLLLRPLGPLRG